MKIRMLESKIAVEAANKQKQSGSLLTMPDASDCTGVVRYISEDVKNVKVGQTVCYGSNRQRVKLRGQDFEIMDADNVFAVLDEEIANVEKTQEA